MDPVGKGSLFLRQTQGNKTKNFDFREGREQDQGVFYFLIIFNYLGFKCTTLICQGISDTGF